MAKSFVKGPGERLDYTEDWSTWLGSDTIGTSTWDVPAGLGSSNEANDSTSTTIWLNGGSIGGTYLVRNRIMTTNSPARYAVRHIFISINKR